MDPVGGPHFDEADPLSPHCGPVGGAGGAWAASGAGRSGADLNAEQCEASLLPVPLNIVVPSEVRAIAVASRSAPATSQP